MVVFGIPNVTLLHAIDILGLLMQDRLMHRSVTLGIPKTTIQNVLHKSLRLHAYKIQLKQEIKPDDRPKRVEFATFMLNATDEDETFLRRTCFLDEATFM